MLSSICGLELMRYTEWTMAGRSSDCRETIIGMSSDCIMLGR